MTWPVLKTRKLLRLYKVNRQGLLLAVSFLTRIPVSIEMPIADNALNEASRYFAIVGGAIGAALALLYCGLQFLFPDSMAIIIVLASGLILTGAFHEDGFADVWDGFGGGWSVSQKLTIMKDSRLGTYGATSLVLLLLAKYELLMLLADHWLWVSAALICAHTLSRAMATSIIGRLAYVQEDAQSKVKPVAKALSRQSLKVLYCSAGSLLLLMWLTQLFSFIECVLLICVLWLTRFLCITWFKSQLRGYTGDCLGAAQQIAELVIYGFCVQVWL
ncbi:adenosylcobinamide-GDP ribazoletransferase [Pseudoalteromonas sp. MMG013]|uniref:adenosylcobinamide-GDP ribazoletransferase n=1 Tax=Pseudoalteromonas sp. MMG013 TaxID=2822687 RepID=UPI001B3815A1|nr:adenosylcobinamide-GDP ribazoletransferase [Pseudoalteromonas sp. MMG013]MBQ4861150.1 adenosylcobinamide-GDP ribazoletransferase [Pseudoalteromonas sp. MMG013]